jgi:hypothetical protein
VHHCQRRLVGSVGMCEADSLLVVITWSLEKFMNPYPAAASENLFFITWVGGMI